MANTYSFVPKQMIDGPEAMVCFGLQGMYIKHESRYNNFYYTPGVCSSVTFCTGTSHSPLRSLILSVSGLLFVPVFTSVSSFELKTGQVGWTRDTSACEWGR